MRPKIVCLCGSQKFKEAFEMTNRDETLAGNIVLLPGVDKSYFANLGRMPFKLRLGIKTRLDHLHFRKIELADEILVINQNGYIGISTCDEIYYAVALGKKVRYLE